MKDVLIIVLAALLVSSFAYAADYAALFGDANHTVYNIRQGDFTLYVFSDMQDHDMFTIEFRLEFPPFATPGSMTPSPDEVFHCGSITTDLAIAFQSCHRGWWLVCSVPVTYSGGQGVIRITDPDPANGIYMAAGGCYPNENELWGLRTYNDFFLGMSGCLCTGTQETTWGAIKSLF